MVKNKPKLHSWEVDFEESLKLVLDYRIEGVPTVIVLDKNLKVSKSKELNKIEILGFRPEALNKITDMKVDA